MKGWHKKSGLRGLPQGPDASAVLSNAYFVPIDEEMYALARIRDWGYLRWSDDIRVFTKSQDGSEDGGLSALARGAAARAVSAGI